MPYALNPLLTFQAFYVRAKLANTGSGNQFFLSYRGFAMDAGNLISHTKRIMYNILGRACSQQEYREIIGARFYHDLQRGDATAEKAKEQILHLFNHNEMTHAIYYKR